MNPHQTEQERRQTKKATMSAWIGSVLEYYDFFIYATAAALVFPRLFFPNDDPRFAVLLSLATFGVGYVMRPIGAIVLGHMGDRVGRKNVLVLCLFLMGLSTITVGFLPTYSQIGLKAPMLLVLMRLIQGFAVAGEISSSSSLVIESAPEGRRGFFASFTLQGVQAGQVLAAAVFLPLSYFLNEEDFMSWGWRIPFILSIVVVIIGLIIRHGVQEPEIFKQTTKTKQPLPFLYALQHHWADMLRVMTMSLMNIIPTIAVTYGAAYATQAAYGIALDKKIFLWIPVIGNIIAVILIPFIGNLSDKIGRRKVIIFGAVFSGALVYPYLYAISQANIPMIFALSILMWGIIYQGYNAIYPSYYPELFPTQIRVTGMAISQNIGTAISAFLPSLFVLIATPDRNIPLIVGSIVFGITLLVGIVAWSSRETSRIRLSDLGNRNARPMTQDEFTTVRAQALQTKGH